MCGLAVILRLGQRPLPPPEILGRMLASIAHRGPDDWGTLEDDDVQLGAVRLAVIDPHGGRQPVRGRQPITCLLLAKRIRGHLALILVVLIRRP